MRQSLNVAEQNYRGESDGFELKTCLGHLRSFLEQLHIQACIPIAVSISDPAPPEKWGKATAYLRTNGILSQMEEAFVTSLYTLVSDEAIHPSVAQREYARIRRNMIIEYGLLFLPAFVSKCYCRELAKLILRARLCPHSDFLTTLVTHAKPAGVSA